jgi:hypothetical protein
MLEQTSTQGCFRLSALCETGIPTHLKRGNDTGVHHAPDDNSTFFGFEMWGCEIMPRLWIAGAGMTPTTTGFGSSF